MRKNNVMARYFLAELSCAFKIPALKHRDIVNFFALSNKRFGFLIFSYRFRVFSHCVGFLNEFLLISELLPL